MEEQSVSRSNSDSWWIEPSPLSQIQWVWADPASALPPLWKCGAHTKPIRHVSIHLSCNRIRIVRYRPRISPTIQQALNRCHSYEGKKRAGQGS